MHEETASVEFQPNKHCTRGDAILASVVGVVDVCSPVVVDADVVCRSADPVRGVTAGEVPLLSGAVSAWRLSMAGGRRRERWHGERYRAHAARVDHRRNACRRPCNIAQTQPPHCKYQGSNRQLHRFDLSAHIHKFMVKTSQFTAKREIDC